VQPRLGCNPDAVSESTPIGLLIKDYLRSFEDHAEEIIMSGDFYL
jgi:hypothetical protein